MLIASLARNLNHSAPIPIQTACSLGLVSENIYDGFEGIVMSGDVVTQPIGREAISAISN